MKRRFFTILLALVLMTPTAAPVLAAEDALFFTDVAEDAWYADAVRFVAEDGIMIGTGGGRFEPDKTVTVAEANMVSARLYSLLSGRGGDIPKMPEGGPAATLYITEPNGQSVVSFIPETIHEAYAWTHMDQQEDLILFFFSDMLDFKSLEAPYETLTLHIDYPEKSSYELTFYPLDWSEQVAYCIDFDDQGESVAEIIDAIDNIVWLSEIRYNPYAAEAWYDDAYFYTTTAINSIPSGLRRDNLSELSQAVETILAGSFFSETVDYASFMNLPCPRAYFALLLYSVLPDEALTPLTDDPVSIPDFNAEAVRALYAAGILTGMDSAGTFNGAGTLTRAQLATICARVL